MSLFSKSRTRRDAQRRVSEAPERAAPTPRRAVDDPFDLDFISQIPIKVYTEREGLPSQFVQALAFDVGGRLWAGTGLGVAQYNGRVWTELPLPEQAMSKQVRSLCAARDRSLWVGTQAGLLRYANGGWRTLGSSAGLDLAGVRARSILETDGVGGSGCEIWVATDHGIARLSNKGWSAFDTGSGLPPENVWTLSTAHDERGKPTVLAGTETGIARFDASRERWSPIASADSCEILGSGVQCLLETTDERGARVLWVGTHGGLARFADGRWSVVDLSPAMTTPEVYALAETADADGARVFWMGTRNDGLARSSRGRWRAWKGGGSGTIGTQLDFIRQAA